ncbi:MAG: cytidylate kinase-like family protein [Treponema sp.]|nr:cytidylate kinase-like family protein [Treponema sp.]
MKKIITISREYGSGGHTIAKLLAENLGYSFYDSEIIDVAAQNSGLSPDFIRTSEQNLSSGWLYNLLLGPTYATSGSAGISGAMGGTPTLPLADQVFNAQRKAIIELAKKGPCVIVGRCADFILRHEDWVQKDELLNVFVYAPMSDKVARAIERKGLDPKTAEKEVKLIDKRRANHYNTFTERTWGKRDHYDLLVNSSLLGLEKTALMLSQIAKI